MYISNEFLDDVDAVVREPQFENHWLRAQEQLLWAAYFVGVLPGGRRERYGISERSF